MSVSPPPFERAPLTPDEAAPILRGTFGDMDALGCFMKQHAPRMEAIASRRAPRDRASRADFTREVIAELAFKTMRGLGLARPEPMASDLWPWLATAIDRVAIDLLRKANRASNNLTSLQDTVARASAFAPSQDAEPDRDFDVGDRLSRARAIFEDDSFPPSYRLALFAWLLLSALERRHLEAAATQVQRSRAGTVTGLVRAVSDAWRLLIPLASQWPSGIAGRVDEQNRFAWIVRSNLDDFDAFMRDSQAAKSSRELIGQWYRRGRRDLEKRLQAKSAEAR